MSYVPRCGCDWWKETRREARDLPQAFIAKWLPVISETTFHFKAPDLVAVEVACFFGGGGVISQCWGELCVCSAS